MYGIINKSIEDLVIAYFGEEKWEAVKSRSNINIDYFISTEPYDDEVTYKLSQAISDEMKMPLKEVLAHLGEWWILKTGKEKYGSLMEAGGNTLKDFLVNLPMFHTRIMLMYPKLTPPEFQISDIEEKSIKVHYFSERKGLQEFVRGLLSGLGKLYNVSVQIDLLESREQGSTHDVFNVIWNE